MEIGRGRIGIINNNDKNVHFDVYRLSIDGWRDNLPFNIIFIYLHKFN
jgi:hypothetical protein